MNKISIRNHLFHTVRNCDDSNFEALALELFNYQARYNELYRAYLEILDVRPESIANLEDIPFLPIEFFKTHSIKTGTFEAASIFTSSGTTGVQTSRHFIASDDFYLQNTKKAWEYFFGPVTSYCFLMLLPAYLERQGSSLVKMADFFVQSSNYAESGFYLNDYQALAEHLKTINQRKIPTVLLGVSFALLDLAEQFPQDLSNIIIMETGGMKGRRKELVRSELHETLAKAFHVPTIMSEYGMTELLSQAYSKGKGIFQLPPTLRFVITDITDPFQVLEHGRTGIINCIDLANIDSCAFIKTQDIGRTSDGKHFEILGRTDTSDIRGCNLLVL